MSEPYDRMLMCAAIERLAVPTGWADKLARWWLSRLGRYARRIAADMSEEDRLQAYLHARRLAEEATRGP